MRIHIKCLRPFNNWDKYMPCNTHPHDVCSVMRMFAPHFPICNITLEDDDGRVIAYAKWSNRRQVHDLGCDVGLECL